MHLPNGVWVLILPTAQQGPGYRGVASIQLWVSAGSAAERASEHGCAHLLEHMVFKPFVDPRGSDRTIDLASVVEQLGGDVNAFTSHDETVFHAMVPADTLDEVLAVMVHATIDRAIEPPLLAREQEVVVEEIRQYQDDPASRSLQLMLGDLYGEHPYGRPVLGSEDEVRSLTPALLRGWQQRQYRGGRLLLVVAGPVDVAAVQVKATALLGDLEPADSSSTNETGRSTPPNEARIRVERDDVQEAYLRFGWTGGSVLDADGVALDVAAVALGQGESSRLALAVRRRARLVSDAHASYFGAIAAGTFMVSAQADPETAEAAILAVLDEVEALARVPLETGELARARSILQSSLVYRRETVQGQAHALGYFAAASGRLGAEDDYFRVLASLDPERVREACARFLRSDRMALSVLLPRERIDARRAKALQNRLVERCRSTSKACASKASASARTRARIDDAGTWHARLPGGLRVVARVDGSVPVVGGWLVWPGGLRLELAREGGIASLIATMLNRGTSRRDGDALAREIEGLAAVLDGFAGHNSLGLQLESLTEHLPTLLARAFECVADPAFASEELDEARRIALADLEAELDDPGHVAYREMLAALYGKHPHGRDLRGTPTTLAAIERSHVVRHWQRHYPLGRAVLALAGDIEVEPLITQLSGLLEPWVDADADVPAPMPAWPGGAPKWPKRPIERVRELDREQGQIVIGFPGLSITDPRTAELDVLCSVLGGQAGRLFESLRERQGLVYQVGASSSEHIDGGHLVFFAAASQDKLVPARRAIELEIERIVSELISPDELRRAKQWLIGQFESGMQRRGRVASRLVFGEVYGLGANYWLRYPERVQQVEITGVRALAREVLDTRRQVTCIVRAPE